MLHPSLLCSTATRVAQAVLTGSHGWGTVDAGGSEGICRLTCACVGVVGTVSCLWVWMGAWAWGAAPCVHGAQPHLGITVGEENGEWERGSHGVGMVEMERVHPPDPGLASASGYEL